MLEVEPMALCMLGKHSTTQATLPVSLLSLEHRVSLVDLRRGRE